MLLAVNRSLRTCMFAVLALCCASVVLYLGVESKPVEAQLKDVGLAAAPAATFAGTNVGAIPDGTSPCWNPGVGAPRDVTFNAAGLSGSPTSVDISMTFGGPIHSFIGDVQAVLIAPNGASHSIFGRTLATTATAFGDSSDLAGPYIFSNNAPAPPNGGWWQAATVAGAADALPTGTYRTTNSGGAGATNPMPPTDMNAAFAGVPDANGTWTLRLTDGCQADTGAIAAATLTIDAAPSGPGDAPVDLNGDGRTDFVVVRNVGGGGSGQVRWFYNFSSGGGTIAKDWGLASDFFISEDFDNDNIDDIAVWRPGPPTVAAFYILNSSTLTARVEAFGQTGDDPTVVADYNNDGAADLAVYRPGATAGAQSTWFYRTTPGGPVAYVPWGLNGDFPAPGDYDGDGSADFVIQRSTGGGQARFWILYASGTQDSVIFGTPTDVIVPGDYDNDGKTDIAVVRGIGGQIHWFYDPSSIPGVQVVQSIWGNSATDFIVQGDYDGDGRTDLAIWRAGVFWIYSLQGGGISTFSLGSSGDYPVANFNSH
jgi:hypothetical protein